jgi:hypothetical protein
VLGAPQRQSQERIEEPFAPRGRFQGPEYALLRLHREEVVQSWQMGLDRPQMAHAVGNFLTNFRGAIGLCNLKMGPPLVHHRQKRHGLAEGQTLPL